MTFSTETLPACPDCAADVDEAHAPNCAVARCPACDKQRLSCACCITNPEAASAPSLWSGLWPGEAEAMFRGWYARLVPGEGWIMCTADEEGAQPDLNRLAIFNATGIDPYESDDHSPNA